MFKIRAIYPLTLELSLCKHRQYHLIPIYRCFTQVDDARSTVPSANLDLLKP